MSDDNKFWLVFWCTTFTLLATAIISCTFLGLRHAERMAELGFQEETIQGSSMHVWRKVQQSEPVVSNIPLLQCVPAAAETLKQQFTQEAK